MTSNQSNRISHIFTFSIFLFFLFTGNALLAQNKVDDQGRKQGAWEKKEKNGKTKYKGQFKDDIPYGKFKYYDEKGILETVMDFQSADTALATHYHNNGKKAAYGYYVNQKKEGKWRFYDKKGVLANEQVYSEGKKNGELKVYNLNGSISRETFFIDDIENGYRKTYDSEGVLLTEGEIKDGQPDGMQIWYRSGNIIIKGAYKHSVPDGEWVYYDADGKPYRTELYDLGVKVIKK